MEYEQIRASLTSLAMVLDAAGVGAVHGLTTFVNPSLASLNLDLHSLLTMLTIATPDRLRELIEFAHRRHDTFLVFPPSFPFGSFTPSEEELKSEAMQFAVLYHVSLLQDMLRALSINQLLKIFDLLPTENESKQLATLQDLQQLLVQFDAGSFVQMRETVAKIEESEPERVVDELPRLIDLGVEHFHLYAPLRHILQMPHSDYFAIQAVVPSWNASQMILLTRMTEMGVFDIVDLAKILVPEESAHNAQIEGAAKVDDMDVESSAFSSESYARREGALSITITDQPPEKCVYKRNVKPPPSVTIEGSQSGIDGTVYIVPILTRCDTMEDLPALIAGNSPVKVTTSRTIAFARLKIMSTTHQLAETMFSLRFELRRYHGDEYELLDSATTDPFSVVSHSTQLKPSRNLPSVVEVVPYEGPPTGTTRVAILGINFQDSPTTRVRFDDIEVMPIFHGPKTLVCHTPRHAPGPVQVFVCNEPNAWSQQSATFVYTEVHAVNQDGAFQSVRHTFQAREEPSPPPALTDSALLAPLTDSAFMAFTQGDFNLTGSTSMLAIEPSYHPVHVAAAQGNSNHVKALWKHWRLRDHHGNTALHWAVRAHSLATVMLLAPLLVHAVNGEGESALEWALRHDDTTAASLVALLVRCGASPSALLSQGLSALHVAAFNHLSRTCSLLLSLGADANELVDGLAPLHCAAMGGALAAAKELLRFDDEGDTPLHWSTRNTHSALSALLITSGADRSIKNHDNEVPECSEFLEKAPLSPQDDEEVPEKPLSAGRLCAPLLVVS